MWGERSSHGARCTWAMGVAVWFVALACGPKIGDSQEEGSSESGQESAGQRPSERGAMYSECMSVGMCDPLEFCVFPADESGFCSDACGGGGDIEPCASAPGQGAFVSCLDIGLGGGRLVCALDCSDGACPSGMRCEAIDTAEGRRDICF